MKNGWAVVTGASSGIGREFARVLARRGQPVVAVARRADRLDALAKEASAGGGLIEPLVADLATEQGAQSVERCMEQLGDVDLLVNNAGLASGGDFVQASLDHEVEAVRVNAEGVLRLNCEELGCECWRFAPARWPPKWIYLRTTGACSGDCRVSTPNRS